MTESSFSSSSFKLPKLFSSISKKEESIIDPGCNGSLIRYSHGKKNLLLLTNINNKKERKEIVLRYSTDEGRSWSNPKIIYNGEAAYSSMTVMEHYMSGASHVRSITCPEHHMSGNFADLKEQFNEMEIVELSVLAL